MKTKFLLVGGLSLSLISCAVFDPEYAAYKKQKQNEANAPSNIPPGGDPYSNIANGNSFGVPSSTPQPGGEVGRYNPNPSTPPFQPLPGVAPSQSFQTIPSNTPSSFPSAARPTSAQTHIVTKGETLWGLGQKYGTKADAIRQANGLTSNLIQPGQTLLIPR